MRQYTVQDFKSRFAAFGFIWPEVIHLIGIRNAQDNPDQFDDVFYLIDKDMIIGQYSGTTNAGSYHLQNFFSPAFGGTAVLASNQQIVDGFEKGQIYGSDGWRQRKPSKIYRDTNKDLKTDEMGAPMIGMWSIHIHAMFSEKWHQSLKIYNWSAGCQGMNVEDQWKDFMVKTSPLTYLTYTLLKEF